MHVFMSQNGCYLLASTFFLLFVTQRTATGFSRDICSLESCITSNASSKDFIKRCNSSLGHQLQGHCCYDLSSDQVIGIDLSYCNLNNIKSILHQTPKVLRVNLTHNPNLTYENTSFIGLTKLRMLILDSVVDCPAQWNWFNTTWQSWTTAEYEKHSVRCINQTDTCELLKTYNYTCPEHSKCTNNGPGSFECRCASGWGGYRCLRMIGQNVTIPITTTVAGATVLLSAVLWFTQRRHVL